MSEGEIVCFEQFLLLSQSFQKLSATEASESIYMWERVNNKRVWRSTLVSPSKNQEIFSTSCTYVTCWPICSRQLPKTLWQKQTFPFLKLLIVFSFYLLEKKNTLVPFYCHGNQSFVWNWWNWWNWICLIDLKRIMHLRYIPSN